MKSTTPRAKLKLSVTLSADVLARIDRDVQREKSNRSSVIERWLRRAAADGVEAEIERATVAYYTSLRKNQRDDDTALSHALSRAAQKVSYDETASQRRGRSQNKPSRRTA